MVPASAAQLLLLLLTVKLMVRGTPVRSLVMVLFSKEEGVFVGKGPAVSTGDVVHTPDAVFVVVPDPEVEPAASTSALLQALVNGAMAARPRKAKLFFKKCLRSIKSIC